MTLEVMEVSPAADRGRLAAFGGAAAAFGSLLADCVVYAIKAEEYRTLVRGARMSAAELSSGWCAGGRAGGGWGARARRRA